MFSLSPRRPKPGASLLHVLPLGRLSEPTQLKGVGAAEWGTVTHTEQIMSSGDKGLSTKGRSATSPRVQAWPTGLLRGMAVE